MVKETLQVFPVGLQLRVRPKLAQHRASAVQKKLLNFWSPDRAGRAKPLLYFIFIKPCHAVHIRYKMFDLLILSF